MIVEFAGMPKAGKTTVLETVRHELRRLNLKTRDFRGGGRFAPIDKSSPAELNLWLATESTRFLIGNPSVDKDNDNIALMDRGIFDRLIFTHALRELGDLDLDELRSTAGLLLMARLVSRVDLVFVFRTSPELSIKRENINKISPRHGRIMNMRTLSALDSSIVQVIERYGSLFKSVELIDTELLDNSVIKTAQTVVQRILSVKAAHI